MVKFETVPLSELKIRLEKALLDQQITALNQEFRDVIESGEIAQTSALFEEEDEPDLSRSRGSWFRTSEGVRGD